MFAWFRERRRRRIQRQPFPEAWRTHIAETFPSYSGWDASRRQRLEGLIQVFLAEKHIEGAAGFEMTDAVRVTVATNACRMILNLSMDYFREVETVLVYPGELRRPNPLFGDRHLHGELEEVEVPLSGEAIHGGPVLLSWDAISGGALHPGDGLNVILHELAHKIDMLTGDANGLPPLRRAADDKVWAEICGREYRHLRRRLNRGLDTYFEDYAAEHPAEFFAVACEYFFERPKEMKRKRPALYGVFSGFFEQDPAAEE